MHYTNKNQTKQKLHQSNFLNFFFFFNLVAISIIRWFFWFALLWQNKQTTNLVFWILNYKWHKKKQSYNFFVLKKSWLFKSTTFQFGPWHFGFGISIEFRFLMWWRQQRQVCWFRKNVPLPSLMTKRCMEHSYLHTTMASATRFRLALHLLPKRWIQLVHGSMPWLLRLLPSWVVCSCLLAA